MSIGLCDVLTKEFMYLRCAVPFKMRLCETILSLVMLLLLTTFWGIPSPPKSFPLLWYISNNDKLEYTNLLPKQPKTAVSQVDVVRLCILYLINQYVVKRKMIRFLN